MIIGVESNQSSFKLLQETSTQIINTDEVARGE